MGTKEYFDLNNCTMVYFQRDNIGTNNYDLRIPVGGSGSTNPNHKSLPRSGRVVGFIIELYGVDMDSKMGGNGGSYTSTYRIRIFDNETESTYDTVVANTVYENSSGNSWNTGFIPLATPAKFKEHDALFLRRNAISSTSGAVSGADICGWVYIQYD